MAPLATPVLLLRLCIVGVSLQSVCSIVVAHLLRAYLLIRFLAMGICVTIYVILMNANEWSFSLVQWYIKETL
jgi:hypothetical protein